jgi:predicted MFS family arabinose efflux permease
LTAAEPTAATRGEWRHGWPTVCGAAVGVGTGAALYQYVSSLFIEPLEATFGWTRADIGDAAALGLLGALSAPLVGRLADRHGVRPVAFVCILLIGAAHLGLASMTGQLWQFMLGTAVIGAAAPGCTALVYSRAVNARFDRGRGFALGVAASGLSVATLVVSPGLAWVIAAYGFRAGYATLAAIAVIVGLPVVMALVREPDAGLDAARSGGVFGRRLAPALRTRGFWLLAAIMLLVNMPAAGVLTQLAPLLGAKGLSATAASIYLALFAAAVLAGRLGVGWLFDRLSARRVAAAVTMLGAAGCLVLLSGVPVGFAAIGVVLVGLVQGAEVDVLAYFTSRLFDRRIYGAIFGMLFTVSLMGTAAGFVLFGRLFTATGSYDGALVVSAVVLTLASLLYHLMPPARADAVRPDGAAG